MPCPNCGEILNTRLIDNQAILYCLNCGGSFFAENGINRISVKSAEKLASEFKSLQNKIPSQQAARYFFPLGRIFASSSMQASRYSLSWNKVSAYPKNLCPKDNSPLTAIHNEDTVPANLNLLRCPKCHGIFAMPHDLVAFRKAQKAKINYFKLWQIPTPSLSALLVFNFLLIITIALMSNAVINQRSIGTVEQAKDLINSITTSKSGRYLFFYFKTSQPTKSDVVFYDATIDKTERKSVSEKPSLTHQLTTGDIYLDNEIYYQIVLIDKNGKEIMTERMRLTLE